MPRQNSFKLPPTIEAAYRRRSRVECDRKDFYAGYIAGVADAVERLATWQQRLEDETLAKNFDR